MFPVFSEGFLRGKLGIRLPIFAAPVDGPLQHLFTSTKPTPYVGEDGYTYVRDAANKGTSRDPRPGSALEFNGIDGRFLVPYHDTLSFSNGTVDQPFSVTFLAYINDTSTTNYILSDTATSSVRNWLLWSSGSKLRASLYSAGGTSNTIGRTSANNLPSATWIYIVMTYDGSGANTGISLDWYEAGVSSSGGVTSSGSGSYTAMSGTTSSSLRSGLDATLYFGGRLADIRVHNTELTTAEIEALVDNPQSLTGHEVAIYHCDEEAGTTAFDSVSADNMTPEYESDFSVGDDGWATVNVTEDAPVSVGGEDNAYKVTLSGGSGVHYAAKVTTSPGRAYNLTGKVYVPSSNAKVDGVSIYNPSSEVALYDTLDQWVDISETFTSAGTSIRLYASDGGIESSIDSDGDVFYIKDIILTPVVEEGKHGTHSGGVSHVTQNTVSFPNVYGWSEGGYLIDAYLKLDSTITITESSNATIKIKQQGLGGQYWLANGSTFTLLCDGNGLSFKTTTTQINGLSLPIDFGDGKVRELTITKTGTSYLIVDDDGNTLLSDTAGGDLQITGFGSAIVTSRDLNGILHTVEYVGVGKWTGLNNYQDEIGSNDCTLNTGSYNPIIIPASLTSNTPTLDVFGEALTYSGRAPKPGRLVNSHCATFDGVGDYVDTGVAFSPSGDFEVSFLFKANPTSNFEMIFDARDGLNDGILILQDGTTSFMRLRVNSSTIITSSAYDDGTWYRLVASRLGTDISLTIYDIDGSELEAVTGTDATPIETTQGVRIGREATSLLYNFNGQLANIKAVDGSTTVFHYPMAEGAGATHFDIGGQGNHGTINATLSTYWGA